MKKSRRLNKGAGFCFAFMSGSEFRPGAQFRPRKLELVADAQHVVKLKPTWPKGYSRLGSALYGLRHLQAAYCAYCRGLVNCPSSPDLQEGRVRVLRDLPRIDYKIGNWREYPLFLKDAAMPNTETRVFCCSDLHVDQNGNIGWCKMLSTTAFRNDVLIVAGDVGDTMNALRHAFRALR